MRVKILEANSWAFLICREVICSLSHTSNPSLTTFLIARLLSTGYKDKKPQVALQTG